MCSEVIFPMSQYTEPLKASFLMEKGLGTDQEGVKRPSSFLLLLA